MPSIKDIYTDIMSGSCDYNIKFRDLQRILDYFDFKCTVRGDHFIYRRVDTPIINIQPNGNKAKGYQVKQVREIFRSRDDMEV